MKLLENFFPHVETLHSSKVSNLIKFLFYLTTLGRYNNKKKKSASLTIWFTLI